MGVNHPHFGTFCAICYQQLTEDTCAIDRDGVKWDVCKGRCAREAGIDGPDTGTTSNPT